MSAWLTALLVCCLYINKPVPIETKVDIENFRILMTASSIESKIKLVILGYLDEEKKDEKSFTSAIEDIKEILLTANSKKEIKSSAFYIDPKDFIEKGICHIEIVLEVGEKQATLTFVFSTGWKDEDE